jgi:ATP-binding cassette subfamily F protein 2
MARKKTKAPPKKSKEIKESKPDTKKNFSKDSKNPGKSKFRKTPEDFPHIIATSTTKLDDHPKNSRDIVMSNVSILYHGIPLMQDTDLSLAYGRRYGLVGKNGAGKTTFLRALISRALPIPENISIYSVEEPIEKSDLSALEAVLEVQEELAELEKENDELAEKLGDPGITDYEQYAIIERMGDLSDRLDELDVATAEVRASKILLGLGFTSDAQNRKCSDFSGGWRMRISLARALFISPDFLVLDEPTAHLDMEAVVWLETYLQTYEKILLVVSSAQDFLNGITTNILLLKNRKLELFGGNYDTFVRVRKEKETAQMKNYKWEQDQIKDMKNYIAKFGHGSSKLARQAQSKEKTLEKMVRAGLTEKVVEERQSNFHFYEVAKLPPPVLQVQNVSFTYPGSVDEIYNDVDFGGDCDSRIALVGPNGAGKSTLINLLKGDLMPTEGSVRRHHHLRLGHFYQHSVDQLPPKLSALQYMMEKFPTAEDGSTNTIKKMRTVVGRFGITGICQTMPIEHLSDGQKSRVAFCAIAEERPNFILFDEPTNNLDADSIDALANAINEWDGGVIVVSHDMTLVQKVATEIWECNHGALTRFDGDIMSFKRNIRSKFD